MPFQPLVAPERDLYRIWVVVLSTSIFRWILIGFGRLFWSLFNTMFITFCTPFSNIDFPLIFDGLFSILGCPEPRFLLENKQFGAFQPFSQKHNKSMSLASVLASFWKAFGIHLVSFFGIIFCIDVWIAFFRILGSFWTPPGDCFALLDQKGSSRGLQKHPARSPFWHPEAAPRPKASKTSPVALKRSSVALRTGPRATCNGSFFNGFRLNVERIWDSF